MSIEPQADFSLDDRYTQSRGYVLLNGVQALVRALQLRSQLDGQAELNTGGFVSGYRGSPLGGLDKELWAQSDRLEALNVQFQPGVNEDLAATAVWGSQQVGLHKGHTVDGVFGLWYGKAPGLDRSCDAIRHANAWGTAQKGGVLLVVGDDPAAKSSSLATQSEFTLQDMMVPILAPADVQEVLDFSILGWEMSRRSGLWVGLKAIADHMDSSATVAIDLERYQFSPQPVEADHFIRREDTPQDQERRLLEEKLPAAIDFAREVGLNEWVTQPSHDTRSKQPLGIVCAGKAYADVREGLALLGLKSREEITAAGIELLKLGMTWPLDPALVVGFASGVERLLVVEEKRAFVETQLKECLYGHTDINIVGKRALDGSPLIAQTGILEPVDVALVIAQLVAEVSPEQETMLANVQRIRAAAAGAPARQERTPLFCAGCPHNTSTRVPDGSRATAGIGCHYMVQWMDRSTDSCTHMGGEGVTWVGEAGFTDEQHIFANLGDGTYFHSGLLAIRQAVAAKVNITYKILFNDAVAMTGGQPTDGELSVAKLIAQVTAEGVSRVVVVSDQPQLHKGLPVAVYDRAALDEVQAELRSVAGTTVLIYQQTCATELRRQRKRGLIEDNKPRLMINEEVCDGCGDCTEKSSCVAVEPVETAQGTKRKINQTACNKDLSCADGFCPAFVEVTGGVGKQISKRSLTQSKDALPDPLVEQATANILITGVGGTGIVTLSALLAVAAKLEGRWAKTLDMTGLAQKGGAVFAHVRFSDQPIHTARIPLSGVDTVIGCDLVSTASTEAMELLNPDTLVVTNSDVLPTADFVFGRDMPRTQRRRYARLRELVKKLHTVAAEEHVQTMFGHSAQTNVFALGFAFQLGGIPLAAANIERAIELNGFAVQENLTAFRAGRRQALEGEAKNTPAKPAIEQLDALMVRHEKMLAAYQGADLVQRYRSRMAAVVAKEQAVLPGSEVLSRAVAESYIHVLMIKDEYEVARLYSDGKFSKQVEAQFGDGAQVRYLMAPPLLGQSKRSFGPWMGFALKQMARLKWLRNTKFDPFGYTQDRALELQQIDVFEAWIDMLLAEVNRQNLALGVSISKLYLTVRGFGAVKARHLARMEGRREELLAEFRAPAQKVMVFDPAHDEAA